MYTEKAKFSVMMWSDAIKTLVYSLVCLDFGQHLVYIIKYVEDFQEVFCFCTRELLANAFYFLWRNICQERGLVYVFGRVEKKNKKTGVQKCT